MNWLDAALNCPTHDNRAHLLIIDNEKEQNAIAAMLKPMGIYRFHVFIYYCLWQLGG